MTPNDRSMKQSETGGVSYVDDYDSDHFWQGLIFAVVFYVLFMVLIASLIALMLVLP